MELKTNSSSAQMPLLALRKPTLTIISGSLNPHKVLLSPSGEPRDWRGLAYLLDLSNVDVKQLETKPDPFLSLATNCGSNKNLGNLMDYLFLLDRYDVWDDIKEKIEEDYVHFQKQTIDLNIDAPDQIVIPESYEMLLTRHDVARNNSGLGPQIYDAYVLYADEDYDFVEEIVEEMEKENQFVFCVRDRDLLGGIRFEHDAITKLIDKRCRRLVIIISSNFLKSNVNRFFLTYAQALIQESVKSYLLYTNAVRFQEKFVFIIHWTIIELEIVLIFGRSFGIPS